MPGEEWFVELHPKGGSQMRRAVEVMRENLELYAKGEAPEWVPVAMRATFPEAKAELARVRKALREGREEL